MYMAFTSPFANSTGCRNSGNVSVHFIHRMPESGECVCALQNTIPARSELSDFLMRRSCLYACYTRLLTLAALRDEHGLTVDPVSSSKDFAELNLGPTAYVCATGFFRRRCSGRDQQEAEKYRAESTHT